MKHNDSHGSVLKATVLLFDYIRGLIDEFEASGTKTELITFAVFLF